MCIWV